MTSGTLTPTRRSDLVGHIWRAVPAGMLGGVVFGLGLRLAMRVAALVEGLELDFTPGGTMFILLFGIVVGAVVGPIAVVLGGIWREHPMAGAALVSAAFGLGLVVVASGSEIADIGHPMVNIATFGSAGAALGLVATARIGRSPAIDATARARGATLVGSVFGTAVGLAVSMPALAWVLDRIDGGVQVYPGLPQWRDPRIGDAGEALGTIVGAGISGVFLGLLLGLALVAMRRRVTSSDRPVRVIASAYAVMTAGLLLLPEGPRTFGNTGVVAVGLLGIAVLIALLTVRFSNWLEPSALGVGREHGVVSGWSGSR